MQKTLLLATAAITLGGFIAVGPAMAATANQAVNTSQTENSSQPRNGQQLVSDATQTIQQFKQDKNFEFWQKMQRASSLSLSWSRAHSLLAAPAVRESC